MANTITIEANEELELIINSKSKVKITVNSGEKKDEIKSSNCGFVWDNGCFLSKDELED
ncbi:MAG: hypothetical protein ACRDA3_15385 [Peptostreptococcaceae bacterium]